MKTVENIKNVYEEIWFVPWYVGLLGKRWDELSDSERQIAVPASLVYSGDFKS